MDPGTATLIAAGIAALASVISAIFSARTDARQAVRSSVPPDRVEELSNELYRCTAGAHEVVRPVKTAEGRKARKTAAHGVGNQLNSIRPRVRIALRGLDDALRRLADVPRMAANYDSAATAEPFLRETDKLRDLLDRVIETSVRRGRRPTWIQRRQVRRQVRRVETVWGKTAPGGDASPPPPRRGLGRSHRRRFRQLLAGSEVEATDDDK